MKKTNIIKIICVLIITIMIVLTFSNYAYGVSLPSNLSNIYNASDRVISNIGSKVLWIVQIVLYAAAVIAFMIAGVKYMTASPEGKAEIKKKMMYLVIGGILLFAAGGIVQLVSYIAMNNI